MDAINISLLKSQLTQTEQDPLDQQIVDLAKFDNNNDELALEEIRAQEKNSDNPLFKIAKDNDPKSPSWWLYNTIHDYLAMKNFTAKGIKYGETERELLMYGASSNIARDDVAALEASVEGHERQPGIKLNMAGQGKMPKKEELAEALPSYQESVRTSISNFIDNTNDIELALVALLNKDQEVVERAKETLVNMVSSDTSKISDLFDALNITDNARVKSSLIQVLGTIGSDDAMIGLYELARSGKLSSADESLARRSMVEIMSLSPKMTIDYLVDKGIEGLNTLNYVSSLIAEAGYPSIRKEQIFQGITDAFNDMLKGDTPVEVREAAGLMLGSIPTDDGFKLLINLFANDQDDNVVSICAHSLYEQFNAMNWRSEAERIAVRDQIVELMIDKMRASGYAEQFEPIIDNSVSIVHVDTIGELQNLPVRQVLMSVLNSMVGPDIVSRPEQAKELRKIFTEDSSSVVKGLAAETQGKIGGSDAVNVLGGYLDDKEALSAEPSNALPLAAVKALDETGSPESVGFLDRLILEKLPEAKNMDLQAIKSEAIRAYSRQTGPENEQKMIDILRSPDSSQKDKASAIYALSTMGITESAKGALTLLIQDYRSPVVMRAAPTFENIGEILPYQKTTINDLKGLLGLDVYETTVVIEELFKTLAAGGEKSEKVAKDLEERSADPLIGYVLGTKMHELMQLRTADWERTKRFLEDRKAKYEGAKAELSSKDWDYDEFHSKLEKAGLNDRSFLGDNHLDVWTGKGSVSYADRELLKSMDVKGAAELPKEKWPETELWQYLSKRAWDADTLWSVLSEQAWERGEKKLVGEIKPKVEKKKGECAKANEDADQCGRKYAYAINYLTECSPDVKAKILSDIKVEPTCVPPEEGQCVDQEGNPDEGVYDCVVRDGEMCASFVCDDKVADAKNCNDELAAMGGELDYFSKSDEERIDLREKHYPRVREFLSALEEAQKEKKDRSSLAAYVDGQLMAIGQLEEMVNRKEWNTDRVEEFVRNEAGWTNEQIVDLRKATPFSGESSYRKAMADIFRPDAERVAFSDEQMIAERESVQAFLDSIASTDESQRDNKKKALMYMASLVLDKDMSRVDRSARRDLETVIGSLLDPSYYEGLRKLPQYAKLGDDLALKMLSFYSRVKKVIDFKRSQEGLLAERIEDTLSTLKNDPVSEHHEAVLTSLFNALRNAATKDDLDKSYAAMLEEKGARYSDEMARALFDLRKNKDGKYQEADSVRLFSGNKDVDDVHLSGRFVERLSNNIVQRLKGSENVSAALAERAKDDDRAYIADLAKPALEAIETADTMRKETLNALEQDPFAFEDKKVDTEKLVALLGRDGAGARFSARLEQGIGSREELIADAEILGSIGGRYALRTVDRLVRENRDPELVAMAVQSLVDETDPEAFTLLNRYFNDERMPDNVRIPAAAGIAKKLEAYGKLRVAVEDAVRRNTYDEKNPKRTADTTGIIKAGKEFGGLIGEDVQAALDRYYTTADKNPALSVAGKKVFLNIIDAHKNVLPPGVKTKADIAYGYLKDKARSGNELAIGSLRDIHTEENYEFTKGLAKADGAVEHLRGKLFEKDVAGLEGLERGVAAIKSEYSNKREMEYGLYEIKMALLNAKNAKAREKAYDKAAEVLSDEQAKTEGVRTQLVYFIGTPSVLKDGGSRGVELLAKLIVSKTDSAPRAQARELLNNYYKERVIASKKGSKKELGMRISVLVPTPSTDKIKENLIDAVARQPGGDEYLFAMAQSDKDQIRRDLATDAVIRNAGSTVDSMAEAEREGIRAFAEAPTKDSMMALGDLRKMPSKKDLIAIGAKIPADDSLGKQAKEAYEKVNERLAVIRSAIAKPTVINIKDLVAAASSDVDTLYKEEAAKGLLDIAGRKGANLYVRGEAMNFLINRPAKGAVAVLDAVAHSPDDQLNNKAGKGLIDIASRVEVNKVVRMEALDSLINVPRKGAIELLEKVARSQKDALKAVAIGGLLEIVRRKGLETELRMEAVESIVNYPVPGAVETLSAVLHSKDDPLRESAGKGLLEIASRRNIDTEARSEAIAVLINEPVDGTIRTLKMIALSRNDVLQGRAEEAISLIAMNKGRSPEERKDSIERYVSEPTIRSVERLSSIAHSDADNVIVEAAVNGLLAIAGGMNVALDVRAEALRSLKGCRCTDQMKNGLQLFTQGSECNLCTIAKEVFEQNNCQA